MGKTVLLQHLKSALEAAKAFMGSVAKTVTYALIEMNDVKADKPETVTFQVPNAGWATGSGSVDYPYFYDITNKKITEADIAIVDVAPDSAKEAKACGLGACKTISGAIRLMSKSAPASAINCEYSIIQGKEATE